VIYNNNNYETPISSKRIELSGAPSRAIGQTHSLRPMQSSSINDQMGWKLWKDKQVCFQMVKERNYVIWWLNMFRVGINCCFFYCYFLSYNSAKNHYYINTIAITASAGTATIAALLLLLFQVAIYLQWSISVYFITDRWLESSVTFI